MATDSAFKEVLLKRLEDLKTEIGLAQKDIELRSAGIERKRVQVESILSLLDAEGTHIDRASLHGILPVSVVDVVTKVLRENRQPLHYKELLQRIEEEGFRVQGQNPSASLIALLHRRADVFARHGGGVWGLSEWGPGPVRAPKTRRREKRKPARKPTKRD